MRAKNAGYFAFVATALSYGLPALWAGWRQDPASLSKAGAALSTGSIVAYLIAIITWQLLGVTGWPEASMAYERHRVALESFYLIGLCAPFALSIHKSGSGVNDYFWQAVVHLLLIPFIDLPLACTILGVLVLAPLYIYMIFDAELSQAQGPTPGWCMLAARAVGYMAAWLVGVGFMQALMMKDEEEGVTHGKLKAHMTAGGKPQQQQKQLKEQQQRQLGWLQRLEAWLMRMRRALSPADRTLMLSAIFLCPPVMAFAKCIRPFFSKDNAGPPAGPFELYIAFISTYMLGGMEVAHLRSSLLRKLAASQDLLCDLLPSHVVRSLLEAQGFGRSRAVSRALSRTASADRMPMMHQATTSSLDTSVGGACMGGSGLPCSSTLEESALSVPSCNAAHAVNLAADAQGDLPGLLPDQPAGTAAWDGACGYAAAHAAAVATARDSLSSYTVSSLSNHGLKAASGSQRSSLGLGVGSGLPGLGVPRSFLMAHNSRVDKDEEDDEEVEAGPGPGPEVGVRGELLELCSPTHDISLLSNEAFLTAAASGLGLPQPDDFGAPMVPTGPLGMGMVSNRGAVVAKFDPLGTIYSEDEGPLAQSTSLYRSGGSAASSAGPSPLKAAARDGAAAAAAASAPAGSDDLGAAAATAGASAAAAAETATVGPSPATAAAGAAGADMVPPPAGLSIGLLPKRRSSEDSRGGRGGSGSAGRGSHAGTSRSSCRSAALQHSLEQWVQELHAAPPGDPDECGSFGDPHEHTGGAGGSGGGGGAGVGVARPGTPRAVLSGLLSKRMSLDVVPDSVRGLSGLLYRTISSSTQLLTRRESAELGGRRSTSSTRSDTAHTGLHWLHPDPQQHQQHLASPHSSGPVPVIGPAAGGAAGCSTPVGNASSSRSTGPGAGMSHGAAGAGAGAAPVATTGVMTSAGLSLMQGLRRGLGSNSGWGTPSAASQLLMRAEELVFGGLSHEGRRVPGSQGNDGDDEEGEELEEGGGVPGMGPGGEHGLDPQQLLNTLPESVGSDASRGSPRASLSLAEWHEQVTIVFADIVGFTSIAQQVAPPVVMQLLSRLYERFDSICLAMGSRVYKVETIGDCYMCATGLLQYDPAHAAVALQFAEAMRQAALRVRLPTTGEPVQIRVGIHSGRVMSGIVGKIRRRFCLFGDTVNTASRMESTGAPGRIHVSEDTYRLTTGKVCSFRFTPRGVVEVKGKGGMKTWWVEACPAGQEQTVAAGGASTEA